MCVCVRLCKKFFSLGGIGDSCIREGADSMVDGKFEGGDGKLYNMDMM